MSSDKSINPNESAENTTNQSTSNDVTDESSESSSPKSSSTPRNNNKKNLSLVQIIDEIPPPPYQTQIPTPSHPRDHITITLTSPPEYAASNSFTTIPNPLGSPNLSHNCNSSSSDALITPTQELKFCKICQEYEDSMDTLDSQQFVDDNDRKLISPCKCKGSLRYVHIGCLNKWRHSNVRAEASYRCEVCKYEYKFYRPRIAKILANSITLHFFTLILLFFTISVLSYMVKSLHFAQDSEDKSSWKNIKVPFLNLHLIHVVIGTSIFSFFGIIFFIIMGCLNGFRSTRRDFCYCTGCENACFCGYGGCYAGDCGGGGNGSDCGGVIILALVLIIAAIFMFGLVGGIVAAYLFAQKITTFFLEKVHDNILEVSKDD